MLDHHGCSDCEKIQSGLIHWFLKTSKVRYLYVNGDLQTLLPHVATVFQCQMRFDSYLLNSIVKPFNDNLRIHVHVRFNH